MSADDNDGNRNGKWHDPPLPYRPSSHVHAEPRQASVKRELHRGDLDLARRKHFAELLRTKISHFAAGRPEKRYRVWVDPLPSRYPKADEAAEIICKRSLLRDFGTEAIDSLITKDSKSSRGIQIADLLLGAAMSDWQSKGSNAAKAEVKAQIAAHLGWADLFADTWAFGDFEWKFNIWLLINPNERGEGQGAHVRTREVKPKLMIPIWKWRAARDRVFRNRLTGKRGGR